MDLAFLLQAVFILVALLCPLSIVALMAWSAWSRHRARASGAPGGAPAQSAADTAEISRMRANIAGPQARRRSRRAADRPAARSVGEEEPSR